MFEDRDRQRRGKRARRKREALGRTADPECAVEHSFPGGEAARLDQTLQGEVASDRTGTCARCFDHGVAGSADGDVDHRAVIQQTRGPQPREIAAPPVFEVVAPVSAELRVEVAALARVLRVGRKRRLVEEHEHAVGDAEAMAVAPAGRRLGADGELGRAVRAAKGRGQHGGQRNGGYGSPSWLQRP